MPELEQGLLQFHFKDEPAQPEAPPTQVSVYQRAANSFPPMPQGPLTEPMSASEIKQKFLSKHRPTVVRPSLRDIKISTEGIGSRAVQDGMTWQVPRNMEGTDATQIPSSFLSQKRFKAKLDEETDLLNSYYGWHGIIEPEYNLLEPYTILDTESYLTRALERKHSLMFRGGFTFTGKNTTFVEYIQRRSSQISYVTNLSMENFLKDIVWNLLVCSNVVLIKIRDSAASGGRANDKNGNKIPVAGYHIVTPYTIYPYLDGYGHIMKWRRFFGDGRRYRDYHPEDIIHFKWNVKPGHIFGTPKITPVRDDIFALRRLEENVELLLMHHLFPLMHVKVGSKEKPCEYYPDGSSEISAYSSMIQNMPKEGVFVTDERVEVSIQGAGNQGVDFTPAINHFKQRIFTGVGVSGLDVGETDTGNRSTADNVSQNLKDQIRSDLQWFCQQFKMLVLKDWFTEAPFHLSVQNAVDDVSLDFQELDPDSQIKSESHHINLYNNHAITHSELRHRLKSQPLDEKDHSDTHFGRHVLGLEKFKAKVQMQLAEQAHQASAHAAASTSKTKITKKFANGGSHTKETVEPTAHAKKAVKELLQPSNQHGRNLDPHKARSSNELLNLLYDQLLDDLILADQSGAKWEDYVDQTLEAFFGTDAWATLKPMTLLQKQIASTTDPDTIYALLKSTVPSLPLAGFSDETETEEVPLNS